MKILAVDDDDIALEVLSEALRRQGHDVETAMDGRQALDRLAHGSIRMVVCDWMMPRMDGIQFCKAVRKGCSDGYVYIILITGRDNPVPRNAPFGHICPGEARRVARPGDGTTS